jgi:hypothetical protein
MLRRGISGKTGTEQDGERLIRGGAFPADLICTPEHVSVRERKVRCVCDSASRRGRRESAAFFAVVFLSAAWRGAASVPWRPVRRVGGMAGLDGASAAAKGMVGGVGG